MNRIYNLVLTFEFPDGQQSYVIWDLEMYCQLREGENFREFILDGEKNGFGVNPIMVHAAIYLNPKIVEYPTASGNDLLLVGKKILLLDIF